MSKKLKDFELVRMEKGDAKPKFQVQSQKEESHYQCLSTTNRDKPEQFMNATSGKQATQPVPSETIYINFDHSKKEEKLNPSQPKSTTSTANNTKPTTSTANNKGAADIMPTPAAVAQFTNVTSGKQETQPVLSETGLYMKEEKLNPSQPNATTSTANNKGSADITPTPAAAQTSAADILKTYLEAKPATESLRNAVASDAKRKTSNITPVASPCSPATPQQSAKSNAYVSAESVPTQMKSSAPSLKSNVSTKSMPTQMKSSAPSLKSNVPPKPAMHPVVVGRESKNLPDTAPGDMQTLASSNKKDGRRSRNKCLLFSIMACCVLVILIVFAATLTFAGLNRSELMKNQAEDSSSTVASNMQIIYLTKQVRDLEESLSQSNTAIESLSNQNQLLSSSIDSHSSRLAAAENTLQSHVTDYRGLVSTSESNHDTLTASISVNYAVLNNRINNLQSVVESNHDTLTASISVNYAVLNNRINNLQSVVNTNRNRANSQISQLQSGINLGSRCRKNSVSCDVNGNSSVYQLSCSTQNIPMTTGVSLC